MQAGNTMGLAQQRCLRFGVHNQLPRTAPLPQYRYAHAETRAGADRSVQGRGRTRCRLTFRMEEHHLGIRGLNADVVTGKSTTHSRCKQRYQLGIFSGRQRWVEMYRARPLNTYKSLSGAHRGCGRMMQQGGRPRYCSVVR